MREAVDAVDERPVVEPDDADREECRQVRQVRRPMLPQRREKAVRFGNLALGRDLEVEHEQGDRDRHDAVAEGLDATRRRQSGRGRARLIQLFDSHAPS